MSMSTDWIGLDCRFFTCAEYGDMQSVDMTWVWTCAECRHLCISNMCRVLTSDMCWPVQQSVFLGKVWKGADCRPLHIVHLYRDWTCQSMDLCRDGNWVNYGPVQILDLSSMCTSAEGRPVQSLYLCRTLQSLKLRISQMCAEWNMFLMLTLSVLWSWTLSTRQQRRAQIGLDCRCFFLCRVWKYAECVHD